MDSATFLLLAAQGFVEGRTAAILTDGGANAPSCNVNRRAGADGYRGLREHLRLSLALIQRIYERYGTTDLKTRC